MNPYKLVYCLLQKIYGQLLKIITYLATRSGFLAQGQGQGCKAKAVGFKAQSKASWLDNRKGVKLIKSSATTISRSLILGILVNFLE